MKTTGNTIFISGGSAGIGLEIAKQFSALGNKVIINGRNKERLENAFGQLKNAEFIQGDLSIESERERIAEVLRNNYPDGFLTTLVMRMLTPLTEVKILIKMRLKK